MQGLFPLHLSGSVLEPDLLERIHHSSSHRSIRALTNDKCDLHLQEHPMLDKLLHLDCFQPFVGGKRHLVRIGRGFPHSHSFFNSFSNYCPDDILYFLEVCNICGREVVPSL